MWFIFLLSFSFLLPVLSARSLRSKIIYFLNAVIIAWVLVDSSKPFIEQAYLGNASRSESSQTFTLIILSMLAIFYLIYGLVKLFQRRKDFKNIISKNHDMNIKNHFSGELNKEERFAFIAAVPGILIAFWIIFVGMLKLY